jgi:hypothetical protein
LGAKGIERICHKYGELIELDDKKLMEQHASHTYSKEDKSAIHYASVDGSMYLTRAKTPDESQWKEIKLGRIFKQTDIVATSEKRKQIKSSTYVAHLGWHADFLPKMEYYLDGLDKIVFIADGARWIWSWIDAMYPKSTQILDYYHAMEHLCAFAKEYFKDEAELEKWVKKQENCLLQKDVGIVIKNIAKLTKSNKKKVEQSKQALIQYYKNNQKRMNYKNYLQQGLLIGWGAMEAAHRNVLQQRLKLSGQRWTNEGLQQMAQLRVAYKSNMEHRIKALINNIAA